MTVDEFSDEDAMNAKNSRNGFTFDRVWLVNRLSVVNQDIGLFWMMLAHLPLLARSERRMDGLMVNYVNWSRAQFWSKRIVNSRIGIQLLNGPLNRLSITKKAPEKHLLKNDFCVDEKSKKQLFTEETKTELRRSLDNHCWTTIQVWNHKMQISIFLNEELN